MLRMQISQHSAPVLGFRMVLGKPIISTCIQCAQHCRLLQQPLPWSICCPG